MGRAYNSGKSAVANAFKTFLTVQSQGLILLSMAWLGSNHENQIAQQVAAIRVVLDAIKAFEAAVIATIDQQTAASLQASGQRLTGLAASNDIRYDHGSGDVRMRYPLSDDWVMWDRSVGGISHSGGIIMANNPWTYQPAMTALLQYDDAFNGSKDEPHINIQMSDSPSAWAFGLHPITAGRYGGIPAELAFIRNL